MFGADGQNGRRENISLFKNYDTGGGAADIHDRHPELALALGHVAFSRRQHRQDDAGSAETGAVNALHNVFELGGERLNHGSFNLETNTVHPYRILNAGLAVDSETLGDGVNNFVVRRASHRPRRLQSSFHISFLNFSDGTAHGHYAAAAARQDIGAGDADPNFFQR